MCSERPESFDVFCAATTAMRVLFPSFSKVPFPPPPLLFPRSSRARIRTKWCIRDAE